LPGKTSAKKGRSWFDWLSDRALRGVIAVMLRLPYPRRVAAMGWFVRRILAPVAGYRRRCLTNLAMIRPDLPAAEHRRIADGVADNMGRTFIENYSTAELLERNRDLPISGPGLPALEAAAASKQPVILVSGHFGNYEAARAALVGRGYDVGGLYRPARNQFFDEHYRETMLAFGGPVFAQGRKGTAGFVRHLKSGGMLVLLFDQFVHGGMVAPFMGKDTATVTSAAALALRYKALLIPFYATRNPDGLTFDVTLEAPVPHSDAETMTRALNTSLEARVMAHPDQWFWVHRRWKLP